MTEACLRPICCRELYSNGEYVAASFNGISYHIIIHWSDNVLSAAFMHQLRVRVRVRVRKQ